MRCSSICIAVLVVLILGLFFLFRKHGRTREAAQGPPFQEVQYAQLPMSPAPPGYTGYPVDQRASITKSPAAGAVGMIPASSPGLYNQPSQQSNAGYQQPIAAQELPLTSDHEAREMQG